MWGKDPTSVTNYQPISLLNVDIKMFTKMLANCIFPVLNSLVTKDPVGFIPGREARNNTIKAITLHHWLTSSKQWGFFLSIPIKLPNTLFKSYKKIMCSFPLVAQMPAKQLRTSDPTKVGRGYRTARLAQLLLGLPLISNCGLDLSLPH